MSDTGMVSGDGSRAMISHVTRMSEMPPIPLESVSLPHSLGIGKLSIKSSCRDGNSRTPPRVVATSLQIGGH